MRTLLYTKQRCRRYAYCGFALLLVVSTIASLVRDEMKEESFTVYRTRGLLQVGNEVVQRSPVDSTKVKENTTFSQPKNEFNETDNEISNKLTNNTINDDVSISDENKTCELPSVAEFPADLFNARQRKHGAIVVHLLIALYMFVGLAIVCDYYFVSSLEVICYKLKIQADVAGASLMAIGSSAPELFASLIGVFITKGDIGIGTILGSAVFNVLFVLGICALVSSKKLNLAWYPATRDTMCYSLTLICLAIVIFDGFVTWKEAATMLMLYTGYLILMWFNERIEKSFYFYIGDKEALTKRFQNVKLVTPEPEPDDETDSVAAEKNQQQPRGKIFYCESDDESDSEENVFPTDDPIELCHIPDKATDKIKWFFTLPINAIFFITIPDIRRRRFRGYVTLTFVMSILWIGFLTYVLVWMVTIVGFTINIPDTVMGLTLIAFGSSVPDALSSIYVAKQGKGDMAVAQALGSNVFDILFGLGLPWLIKTLIFDLDSTIEVQSVGMLISCFIIFVLMLSTLGALYYENFCLSRRLGWLFLATYAIFLIISVVLELYIWSAYHFPTCKV